MRFVNNRTGTSRLKNNGSYTKGLKSNFSYQRHRTPKKESEDTKTRRDIYSIIDRMSKENKGSIEIEIFLTNQYPNYSEYIIKMINQYFTKLNTNKIKEVSDSEKGDER